MVSGEAILSAENSGKPFSAPNPAGGAHSAPQTPICWGGGLAAEAHALRTPPSLSAFGVDFRSFGRLATQ